MLNPFRRAAAENVAARTGFDAERLPVSLPPDHAKGDYAVGCFPAAKALKKGEGLDSLYGSIAVANKFNLANKVYKESQKAESYVAPSIVQALTGTGKK